MSKSYLAFAFDRFYPEGGWSDFIGTYENVLDAIHAGHAAGRDHVQVIEIHGDNAMIVFDTIEELTKG